jgi:hypothetical protein
MILNMKYYNIVAIPMIFTLPVVIAILIAILACVLLLEPENLSKNTIE